MPPSATKKHCLQNGPQAITSPSGTTGSIRLYNAQPWVGVARFFKRVRVIRPALRSPSEGCLVTLRVILHPTTCAAFFFALSRHLLLLQSATAPYFFDFHAFYDLTIPSETLKWNLD